MHTKWTARRLAADAMFAAMVTVLGLVSISTGNLKITVEALPVFLGALASWTSLNTMMLAPAVSGALSAIVVMIILHDERKKSAVALA